MRGNYIFAAMAAIVGDGCAQELAPDREWIGGAPLTRWTRLTGDWGGLRTDLEALGIEAAGLFVADFTAPWSGDTRRRWSLPTWTDVNVAFDLETLIGLPRTLAYVDAYALAGRQPSLDVGDFQTYSNISGPAGGQIAEVWVETWLFDRFRVKLGKNDFNSEFAVAELSAEFVNSTAAVPPTIVGYPTYPNPAMAVNVFYQPDEFFYVGFGCYDGANAEGVNTGRLGPAGFFGRDASSAYFFCEEVGAAWQGGGTWGAGRVALGAFQHTADFVRYSDGGTESGTAGGWVTIEQRMWRERPTEPDDQGIGAFFTVGWADEDVSPVATSIALGVTWTGALTGRDFDAIGFGAFHNDMSDVAGAGTSRDETQLELFYKLQLTPAVSIKPEVQYIVHPGGVAGVDDVLVGLLRVEMLF